MPSGPETRCSPLCLTDVIRLLPPAARTRIEEIGHGKLLQFKLDGLSSRVLLGDFMSRGIVHEDDIEFPVGATSIWITRKVVEDALPLPSGSIKELPKLNDAEKEEVNKEYNKMFEALFHVQKREKEAKAEEEAKGKKGKGKRVKGKSGDTATDGGELVAQYPGDELVAEAAVATTTASRAAAAAQERSRRRVVGGAILVPVSISWCN